MKFNYIAIEREYASGGSYIGKKIGGILGIPCFGREIPEITAQKNDVSVDRILELEEDVNKSFLYSLSKMSNYLSESSIRLATDSVLLEEMSVIRELAGNGPAVFVGRTAAYALKDRTDVLKVFIRASMNFRETRAIKEYEVCRSEVTDVIKKADRTRAHFYRTNFGKDWKDYSDYHMVLDSSHLGLDKCAEIIAACAK